MQNPKTQMIGLTPFPSLKRKSMQNPKTQMIGLTPFPSYAKIVESRWNKKDQPWPNSYDRPRWLSEHGHQGSAQGYVQLDKDTSGRHDHLLMIAYLNFQHGKAFRIIASSQLKNDKQSDVTVNRLALDLSGWGSKEMKAAELTSRLFNRLCEESLCDVSYKGVLSRDMFLKLQIRAAAAGR